MTLPPVCSHAIASEIHPDPVIREILVPLEQPRSGDLRAMHKEDCMGFAGVLRDAIMQCLNDRQPESLHDIPDRLVMLSMIQVIPGKCRYAGEPLICVLLDDILEILLALLYGIPFLADDVIIQGVEEILTICPLELPTGPIHGPPWLIRCICMEMRSDVCHLCILDILGAREVHGDAIGMEGRNRKSKRGNSLASADTATDMRHAVILQ